MFQLEFGSTIEDILGTIDKTQEEEYLIKEQEIVDEIEYENKPNFQDSYIKDLSADNDTQVW